MSLQSIMPIPPPDHLQQMQDLFYMCFEKPPTVYARKPSILPSLGKPTRKRWLLLPPFLGNMFAVL